MPLFTEPSRAASSLPAHRALNTLDDIDMNTRLIALGVALCAISLALIASRLEVH